MKFIRIFVLSLLVLALPMPDSIAGNETGNGGDVVVCRDSAGKITSIELLDLFEARVYTGQTVDLGEPTLSFEQKLEIALKRLERFSPRRAQSYRDEVKRFMKDGRFASGVSLVDIPDSDHQGVPAGCAIEQIAIQKKPLYEGYPKYLVNKDLWDALDTNNQVGLALHEAVYTEALSYGHTNSVASRALNGMILTSELNSISQTDFIDRLLSLGFPVEVVGVADGLMCSSLGPDDARKYSSADLLCGFGEWRPANWTVAAVNVPGIWKAPSLGAIEVSKLLVSRPSGSQAEWKVVGVFLSGRSMHLEKQNSYSITFYGYLTFDDGAFQGTVREGEVFLKGEKVPLRPGSVVSISKTGFPHEFTLREATFFAARSWGAMFDGEISFYENQNVKRGRAIADGHLRIMIFETRAGTDCFVPVPKEVAFDEEGFAIEGCL